MSNVEERALEIRSKADGIVVASQDDLDIAQAFLISLKSIRKEIDRTFAPVIKKAHDAHKEAIAQKKKHEAPILDAEKLVKGRVKVYLDEQERLRAEEAAAQLAIRKAEEDAALAAAEAAEKDGDSVAAERLIESAAKETEQALTEKKKPSPQLRGRSHTRKVWKWEIVDESKIPREYLVVDTKKIGAAVRSNSGNVDIPGVRTYEDTVVAI